VLWARSPEVAEEVDKRGRNSRYLGDIPLTNGLRATGSLAQAVQDAHVLIMGAPSHGFRGVLGGRCARHRESDPVHHARSSGRFRAQASGSARAVDATARATQRDHPLLGK
jgi:glycerol-3-phosphate dehydrogenase